MYEKIFKRLFDFILSLCALIVLSPVLVVLIVVGSLAMKGNPFFFQPRPGKIGADGKERVFKLIKFRTMSNAKDAEGRLLPDEKRLGKYGEFLRSTSLDELPELLNILSGDMSIVGPRPLLVKYLPYYTEEQRKRHSVRPGLTGLAQAKGRNGLDWDAKLNLDLEYVRKISLLGDIKIILLTVKSVVKKEGISQEGQATMEDFVDYVNAKKSAENTNAQG